MFSIPNFYTNTIGMPLRLTSGVPFAFTAPGWGRHNSLIVDTIELFGPRYAPNSFIIFLQDTLNNIAIYEQSWLAPLGLSITAWTQLPDILLYHETARMLFFLELVTLHGPISQKRKLELEELCRESNLSRTYISVFFSRDDFRPYATHIAWDTMIWLAQIPDHVIYYQ